MSQPSNFLVITHLDSSRNNSVCDPFSGTSLYETMKNIPECEEFFKSGYEYLLQAFAE